jgi:hypothetical protein
MSELSQKHNKELIQFGGISALFAILVFVVIYIMGAEYFLSPMVWISSYAMPLVFSIWASIVVKRKQQGYLEFREALKINFGVLVITGFVSTLFSYLMFNFVDQAFAESFKQLTIEKTIEFMNRFNVPESEIDKAIDDLIKKDLWSASSLLKSLAYTCIGYFIEALIVAAIIKKKKPEDIFNTI